MNGIGVRILTFQERVVYRFGAIFWLLCATAWLLPIAGCSHVDKPLLQETEHLRPLAVLFGKYLASHQGKPPADEKALRDFVQSLSPDELQTYGASNVETIYTSTRDKKPYILNFNSAANPGDAGIVAYEQEGLAGKRYVATSLGEVKLIELAELQKLVPAAK